MKEPKTLSGHFLQAIGVRQLFQKKQTPSNDPLDLAIALVNEIKSFVNSGTAVFLFKIIDALIPGDQKDWIAKVRKSLVFALIQMELANPRSKMIESVAQNEQLNEALLFLRGIEKVDRNPLYEQLAGRIYSELSNEDLESAIFKVKERYAA